MGKLTALKIENLTEPGRYPDGDGLFLELNGKGSGRWLLRGSSRTCFKGVGVADDCCSRKGDTLAALALKKDQRRVLVVVVIINFAMLAIEFGGGILAHSSALMADSVDMFGDAVI